MPAIDVDAACDEMVAGFLFERHLPAREDFDPDDNAARVEQSEHDAQERLTVASTLQIQVVGSARVLVEGDAAVVRHSLHNTRVPQEQDPRGVELDVEDAVIVEEIFAKPPSGFVVAELSEPALQEGEAPKEEEDRLRVVRALVNDGVLQVI